MKIVDYEDFKNELLKNENDDKIKSPITSSLLGRFKNIEINNSREELLNNKNKKYA
jgi:hypothetical protein